MQASHLPDSFDSGTQVEVIGIAKENLNSEFFEDILRDAFYRGQGSHWHEDWGFDFAVRRDQAASTGWAGASFDVKIKRHCGDCSNVCEISIQPRSGN